MLAMVITEDSVVRLEGRLIWRIRGEGEVRDRDSGAEGGDRGVMVAVGVLGRDTYGGS